MILEQMSTELSVPLKYVERVVNSASHQYKGYTIPKRNGGERLILHPSRRLKALQRWLLSNVIESWPVHQAAMAYRSQRSIFDNAKAHAKSNYLLRMDMENFFPSITSQDMFAFMAKRPTLFEGWTAEDQDGFCRLIFRKGRLTIGAPTSPAISNAICLDLDSALSGISIRHGVVYTRYADDLFFSSGTKQVLYGVEADVKVAVTSLQIPRELRINAAKTKHSSKRGTRRVTGIVLGSDGVPYVSRETKRYIRSLVNQVDRLNEPERPKLAGLIAYVTGFEPDFMNRLILKYGPEKVERATKGFR
jgi:RNA-directed DNA polymerase